MFIVYSKDIFKMSNEILVQRIRNILETSYHKCSPKNTVFSKICTKIVAKVFGILIIKILHAASQLSGTFF